MEYSRTKVIRRLLRGIVLPLFMLALLALPLPVLATGITVSVDAPAEATVGAEFTTRVNIANVTNLDAVVFRVRFDPKILDLSTKDADSNGIYDSIVNGEVGGKKVEILATVLKESGLIGIVAEVEPPLSGATGSGYLAELHFHALSRGTSTIGLENYSLSNATAETITATWIDGSVTTSVPSSGGPSGGGGGGAPGYSLTTDLFGSKETNYISYTGKVVETIEATSPDGNLGITIPKGTIAKEKDGTRLKGLAINAYEDPPAPPADANIIGLAYDFGPNGATFDPPMTLTWSYDPDTLGDVTEESLVLAYYDEVASKWVELEGVVDTENNTITARVAHFTVFAIIGTVPPPPLPVPAAFAVSDLVISPREVYVGEPVNIEVLVANTGGESGSLEVAFKINGAAVIEAREVTLSPGLQLVSLAPHIY